MYGLISEFAALIRDVRTQFNGREHVAAVITRVTSRTESRCSVTECRCQRRSRVAELTSMHERVRTCKPTQYQHVGAIGSAGQGGMYTSPKIWPDRQQSSN